ncbi:MAG: PaaI family thioesterase [Candidatus Riflebacteria bacterium HGW-Riflebacteria-1]|nr:MAG: PaaI family thioesterase [Candidatus Riflebacteria bacterium HGW-Riflebacteria-1]
MDQTNCNRLKQVRAASSHAGCLLCGSQNPLSMHLNFAVDEQQVVHANFKANDELQGYQGMVHGGVICALLDSAMTHCLFNQDIEAVTGELTVKFVLPVPCRASLELRAWVEKSTNPLYFLKAELSESSRLLACAQAKFMRTK